MHEPENRIRNINDGLHMRYPKKDIHYFCEFSAENEYLCNIMRRIYAYRVR